MTSSARLSIGSGTLLNLRLLGREDGPLKRMDGASVAWEFATANSCLDVRFAHSRRFSPRRGKQAPEGHSQPLGLLLPLEDYFRTPLGD
jgi:hypothetical protein